MKTQNKANSIVVLTAAVLSVVFASVGSFAQNVSINELTPNKYALENLLNGIDSENDGVKRSAIYFAGKYRIAEAEDALIVQLKEEKDPSTRILIALVLFEMGSEEGLMEVKNLSLQDADSKVRRMATYIYHEYLMNDANSTALNSR